MAPKPKPPVCVYDGPMEGEGCFFYKSGATYNGQWKMIMPSEDFQPPSGTALEPRRVRHGKGCYQDGMYSYEGEFAEDEMHGSGSAKYGSGATYHGEFKHNRYDGKGKYNWPDGKVYEGEFMNNIMHGNGTLRDANGHSWTGQFVDGSGPGLTYDLP